MKIAAIPTKLGHVQFRSRLEARWASFFNLAGWDWHYEPIDMHGWIPDFVLLARDGKKIFVEVKPIFWRVLPDGNFLDDAPYYSAELRKAREAEIEYPDELLILGAHLPALKNEIALGLAVFCDNRCFNNLGEWVGYEANTAALGIGYRHWMDYYFKREPHRSIYRIDGDRDVRRRVIPAGKPGTDHAWALAGNAVQWRRPR